jgi:hypothetical protein
VSVARLDADTRLRALDPVTLVWGTR